MEIHGSILGTRVLRTEDPRFLTGNGTFIDNLAMPGALHVAFVQSTVAHGRIVNIDLADARSMAGVAAIYTAADHDLAPQGLPNPRMNEASRRPMLAVDTVRFVGELIAMVVAETRAQAVDAANAVIVDYEPYPAVTTIDGALAPDAPRIHPSSESNIAIEAGFRKGDEIFNGCDVIVRQRIENQRVAPCPLEVRANVAKWVDGKLTMWSCSQGAHGVRDELAEAFGLAHDHIHVITPDVGGGFGAKGGTYPEDMLVPWAARRLGRPVRWTETRSESMVGLDHGRGQVLFAELGGTRDGKFMAYRLTATQDGGAYASFGCMMPFITRSMAQAVYNFNQLDVKVGSVFTNTSPVGAYRGAGRPEASHVMERVVDVYAAEIDLDPAELRRRNFIQPDQFPFVTAGKMTYDCGDFEGALDRALAASDYAGLRRLQGERRASGGSLVIGIGVASYVEVTGGGQEFGSIEVLPNGRAIVRTGTSPHGQGHQTSFAMIASDLTGIPMDRIDVRFGDTDDVARGNGTGGSRSLQLGGSAVKGATEALIEQARALAAQLLEANPDDVVLDRQAGQFHVAGTPAKSLNWHALADSGLEPLNAQFDLPTTASTFPFGTHVAVVEVDSETGFVRLVRHVACDDAGTILNPLLVDGQVHGGIAQGVAQTLFERVAFDDDGNPITANFADYAFPSAAELPMFERVAMETPTPLNSLGAKGIGEAGTIGSTPAVHNAVLDALSHLGVKHIDMPTTPERIWRALTH